MKKIQSAVLFKNSRVYTGTDIPFCGIDGVSDFVFADGELTLASSVDISAAEVTVFDNIAIFPGFADVHVHFREPGFSYKETIASGSLAAAAGGYTTVCTMPNLSPVPDGVESLEEQLKLIRESALINVIPYGSITKGEKGQEMSDLEGMAPNVIGFSDDGKGVQNPQMMEEAMVRTKALNKIIAAHCEDESLLFGGYIHKGKYAQAHGHRGICSESEWRPIERDIELVRKTGCPYHVCHISAKESVELIRKAKAEGLDVSCETGPHYLVMSDADLKEEGRFKMNPPLRDESDRLALLEGIMDGTVDMIATDHAPHSEEEKSRGLEKSAFGITGIETAFPVLYTDLVKNDFISLNGLVALMSIKPSKRFGFKVDVTKSFTAFDLNTQYTVDPEKFLSKGKATPFAGRKVFGKCLLTVCDGKVAYKA